ncbi:TetR/AcrR family transcriptional regulator [Agrobacterium sp. BA1120]|uniref:TetR/AcrR family transcriptional regulator n=1 Tax=Agrobacterium sp. BA1120 TaxID=3228927 RepID=UPI00336A024B
MALQVFWKSGFEAASMGDLTDAMGITSPSLYAAYGSKEALFLEALQHYRTHYAQAMLDVLYSAENAAGGLSAMFETAIDLFTRADRPHGCMVVLAEAGNAPASGTARQILSGLRLQRSDEIAARLQLDVSAGHLHLKLPVQPLADMYAALLQGIAVAARDGTPRNRLSALYKPAILLLIEPKNINWL